MFLDELNKRLYGKLKATASARSLGFIPGAGLPDVTGSCEPIDDPHRHLLGWKEAGFYLVPGKVLRIWIGQAPIKFLFVPLGYGNLTGVSRNTVPDLLKQLHALLNGKAKDLFQKCLRCHGPNVRGFHRRRKLRRGA